MNIDISDSLVIYIKVIMFFCVVHTIIMVISAERKKNKVRNYQRAFNDSKKRHAAPTISIDEL